MESQRPDAILPIASRLLRLERHLASLAANLKARTKFCRDPDILLDTCASLAFRICTSAPGAIAWLTHKDPHAILHSPMDVLGVLTWYAGFAVLSMAARKAACNMRHQSAASRPTQG